MVSLERRIGLCLARPDESQQREKYQGEEDQKKSREDPADPERFFVPGTPRHVNGAYFVVVLDHGGEGLSQSCSANRLQPSNYALNQIDKKNKNPSFSGRKND